MRSIIANVVATLTLDRDRAEKASIAMELSDFTQMCVDELYMQGHVEEAHNHDLLGDGFDALAEEYAMGAPTDELEQDFLDWMYAQGPEECTPYEPEIGPEVQELLNELAAQHGPLTRDEDEVLDLVLIGRIGNPVPAGSL